MKGFASWFCLFLLGPFLFSQQITEESRVINVEVPVRVYDKQAFVDNLSVDDFEIFEDGIPQEVEAVYFVKNKSIERRDERKRFAPETTRQFFLFFEVSEYTAKLGRAVDYFIQKVIMPGDNLIIVTPLKTYRQTYGALKLNSREELSGQLKALLRKDINMGYTEYRQALKELTGMALSLASDDERDAGTTEFKLLDSATASEYSHFPFGKKLMRYAAILRRIESLRRLDQRKILGFAQYLKDKVGQKYVFFIYQREVIPQIDPSILNKYMELYQDKPSVTQQLKSLFLLYRRGVSFDVDRVKKGYADAAVSIHFLFITPPTKHISGLRFHEQSEDIFSAFIEIAKATGGFTESSANPKYLFSQAVKASKNYYLLYYSPRNYKEDGKFHKIEIRVKNKNYRVLHRIGYFAD